MQTIANRTGKILLFFLVAVTLFAGCAPPGARALLGGKRLLEKGKYPEAVEKLQAATALLGGTNAQAYNYLGLACHKAGKLADAGRAYQRALALNPDLAEARYNLGCLCLDEGKVELAEREFTAFTLRRGNEPEGWVKLGSTQLQLAETGPASQRAAEAVAAERAFNTALRLNPQNPEALTGVGLARVRRGRAAEAPAFFRKALAAHAGYAPALLNLAIVEHEYLNDPRAALASYREYLALKPAPENADAVKALVNRLEVELSRPTLAATAAPATARVAPPVAQPKAAIAEPPPTPRSASPTRTEPVENGVKRMTAEKSTPPPSSNPAVAPRASVSEPARSVNPPSPKPTAELPVVTLAAEPAIRAAEDTPDSSPPAPTSATAAAGPLNAPPTPASPSKPARRGLLQHINPANLFAGNSTPDPTGTPVPAKPEQGSQTTAVSGAPTPAGSPAPKVFARYAYRSPGKPISERHSDAAERAFAQAVQAHQAQRLPEAMAGYRRALQLSPAYYDAYYNLAVAAAEAGNRPLALSAYEQALAIRPDSADARYNFALELKQSNYPLDAANELEKILRLYPNDSRTHLALANLYAQQLDQPALARAHYLKVLETDPRNPQAPTIRYWLTERSH